MKIFISLFSILGIHNVLGCGITTHIEIAHRATQSFKNVGGNIDYKQLILENQDAFQAGNPYPDAYYDSICQGGKFHSVSEDTHWAPFLTTTIQYIRDHYPQPWNQDARKLVVFLLGFASHQVADVSWHSLDIDQGFLTTMGDINFFGSFPSAHSVGDTGGDVLSVAELDLQYISTISNWYIPVKDLYEIYKMYYNNTVIMKEDVIIECTTFLFLARLGEKLAFSKLYVDYSAKSPFMVEEFESYFLGGVDDMAMWSQRVWHDTIHMLENGTDVCDVPHNPIYIKCSQSTSSIEPPSERWNRSLRGLRSKINLYGLDKNDVKITPSPRGVYLSPTDTVKEQLEALIKKSRDSEGRRKSLSFKDTQQSATFYVREPYARLGQSMTQSKHFGTESEDLVLGAPGYGKEGQAWTGRVYVIFGTNQVLHNGSHDLDEEADVILQGFHAGDKFGSAVTSLDLNLDGIMDLVVSAPSVGSKNLTYHGEVYVFYGSKTGLFSSSPNITITCTVKYCNFGWSLSRGDLNQDGHLDLLIGSPYAPADGRPQAGMVSILYSSSSYQGYSAIHLTENDMNVTYRGDQEYGWFGHKVLMHTRPDQDPLLLVSQPTLRKCANPNCTYSPKDIQSTGSLSIISPTSNSSIVKLLGGDAFQKLGAGFAMGDPFGNGSLVLAVGSSTKDIEGEILKVSAKLVNAGKVDLYKMDIHSAQHQTGVTTTLNRIQPAPLGDAVLHPIAVYEGDRQFGRFGGRLMFTDVTGDGIDDMIVGASFRTNDITEELFKVEQGAVYVFKGGSSFSIGNVTRSCDLLSPVKPCPQEKAYKVLSSNEGESRFGTTFTTWRFSKKSSLVISAPRSNRADRLAGEVFVYNL